MKKNFKQAGKDAVYGVSRIKLADILLRVFGFPLAAAITPTAISSVQRSTFNSLWAPATIPRVRVSTEDFIHEKTF